MNRAFVRRLSTLIGSYLSLLGVILALVLSGAPIGTLAGLLLFTGVAGFLLLLILEIMDYRRDKPRRFKKDHQIVSYLERWIRREGRVAIFSRDMTWASDSQIRNLLISKAAKDDLSIYVPKVTDFVRELESEGAHVYCYPELGYVSKSRFTIVKQGRMDAEVAIGRNIHGVHVVDEFGAGDHPAYALAEDLTEIVAHYHKISDSKQER